MELTDTMKEYSEDPPDGGYGWVVVISAFLSRGLTTAILKNFGLFFLEIQNYYNVLTSTVSWVTSTSIAVFQMGGEQEMLHLHHLLLVRSCDIFPDCIEFSKAIKDKVRNDTLQSKYTVKSCKIQQ